MSSLRSGSKELASRLAELDDLIERTQRFIDQLPKKPDPPQPADLEIREIIERLIDEKTPEKRRPVREEVFRRLGDRIGKEEKRCGAGQRSFLSSAWWDS